VNDARKPSPRRQPLIAGLRLVLSALAAGILASGALLGLSPAAVASTAAAKPLAVTTSALPAANGGASYSATLTATGGIKPYTWSITAGALPAGLKLHPATGIISGTSSAVGTADFTVTVTDSETPAATASANESITVDVAPLAVTTVVLPQGTVGTLYSATLAAAGGIPKYTWSITAGALPAGLKLHPATGLISGTPTGTGTTDFTVTVTDAESPPASASATESITVPAALEVTTVSLPAATTGSPYSATLTAAGGTAPYTWSITAGTLPPGLTLDASTGVISGTPSAPGNASFTVEVTDSGRPALSATATLSITVVSSLAVTTLSLPAAVNGSPYSSTLAATGGAGPYTWSLAPGAGTLPAGLTLNSATGTISGAASVDGVARFTVTVTDSESPPASATATLSITVVSPLVVTTTSLPAATTGSPYSATLTAAGGTAPYTWSITAGTLPPGLTLDASTGVISGTPSAPGNASFTVEVTDSGRPALSATATLNIDSVP